MIELLLIYFAAFGAVGLIGSLEKIPVIDRLLQKSVEKLQK
jgi:hypothetical protein